MAPSRRQLARWVWAAVQTLAFALLLVVVIVFIAGAFPDLVGAEHSLITQSGSMEPAIGIGSLTFIDDTPPREIVVGDVITFKDDDGDLITHRVVEIHRAGQSFRFRTKGDANAGVDPDPVYRSAYVGKVMEWPVIGLATVPLAGYVFDFATTRTGWIVLVVVPVVLLITTEIWSLYREATVDG